MLYQLYETHRALLSPFSEFASASAKLYNHPLSPFAHSPMAQRVAAGFDLMHRLAKEYEKPEFDITKAMVDGVEVAVQEQVALRKAVLPAAALQAFHRCIAAVGGDEIPTDGAGGRAAFGPPLDAAARDRARAAAASQGLHHRLDRRAHGAGIRRSHSTSTTTCAYIEEFIRMAGPERQRDLGVPADRSGAGRRVADGQPRREDRRGR